MRFYQTGKSDARAVVVKVTVLAVIIKYCAISCGMILSNAVYAAHLVEDHYLLLQVNGGVSKKKCLPKLTVLWKTCQAKKATAGPVAI
ncbi:hypothetical protein AAG906_017932 [Vitis piasezkii]